MPLKGIASYKHIIGVKYARNQCYFARRDPVSGEYGVRDPHPPRSRRCSFVLGISCRVLRFLALFCSHPWDKDYLLNSVPFILSNNAENSMGFF
jgi:hypothetical protein